MPIPEGQTVYNQRCNHRPARQAAGHPKKELPAAPAVLAASTLRLQAEGDFPRNSITWLWILPARRARPRLPACFWWPPTRWRSMNALRCRGWRAQGARGDQHRRRRDARQVKRPAAGGRVAGPDAWTGRGGTGAVAGQRCGAAQTYQCRGRGGGGRRASWRGKSGETASFSLQWQPGIDDLVEGGAKRFSARCSNSGWACR